MGVGVKADVLLMDMMKTFQIPDAQGLQQQGLPHRCGSLFWFHPETSKVLTAGTHAIRCRKQYGN